MTTQTSPVANVAAPASIGMLRVHSYFNLREVPQPQRSPEQFGFDKSDLQGAAAQAQIRLVVPFFDGLLHIGVNPNADTGYHDMQVFFPIDPDNPTENFRLLLKLLPDCFNGWSMPDAFLYDNDEGDLADAALRLYWELNCPYPPEEPLTLRKVLDWLPDNPIEFVEGPVEDYDEKPQATFSAADAARFAELARALGAE